MQVTKHAADIQRELRGGCVVVVLLVFFTLCGISSPPLPLPPSQTATSHFLPSPPFFSWPRLSGRSSIMSVFLKDGFKHAQAAVDLSAKLLKDHFRLTTGKGKIKQVSRPFISPLLFCFALNYVTRSRGQPSGLPAKAGSDSLCFLHPLLAFLCQMRDKEE